MLPSDQSMPPLELITAEFHCHTRYSKDSLVKIRDLARICNESGIQKLVITDHDTIVGALQARELDPRRFVVGEEIMTRQGELLGFFVQEHIPPGLSAMETIELLRSQGAFISVSHPFDNFREGHWDQADLVQILPYVDAIEVFNARCLLPRFNHRAIEFSQHHHMLVTVGSDAHTLGEIGRASLTMPDFADAASLKHSLSYACPHLRLSGLSVHFYSRYACWRKTHLS